MSLSLPSISRTGVDSCSLSYGLATGKEEVDMDVCGRNFVPD